MNSIGGVYVLFALSLQRLFYLGGHLDCAGLK